MMKASIFILIILILTAKNIFAQYDRIAQEYFEKLVPYDSLRAVSDLKNDSVFILNLSGFEYSFGEPFNINEELEYVESRFGFKFRYDGFMAPRDFVQKKQNEYNRQVYKYLDSILGIDSKDEINTELLRLGLDRVVFAIQSDESIIKYIRKEFSKENKVFKDGLIEADLVYRDRKFEIALEKYQELKLSAETEEGLLYLQTSVYHCLMNLKEFDKAKELTKYDVNRKAKRRKH
jgi:hypothetical protein